MFGKYLDGIFLLLTKKLLLGGMLFNLLLRETRVLSKCCYLSLYPLCLTDLTLRHTLFLLGHLFAPSGSSLGPTWNILCPSGGHNASDSNWRRDRAFHLFSSITPRSQKSQQKIPHEKGRVPFLPRPPEVCKRTHCLKISMGRGVSSFPLKNLFSHDENGRRNKNGSK